MSGNLPTCNWCGRAVAVTPARVRNLDAEYLVHPGECEERTEAYVIADAELHAEAS